MSSSVDVSSVLSAISAMETQLATLRAQLGGAPSGVKSSPAKTPTEKKPRKKSDAPPTAWRLFADRVRELLRANGYEGKAIGTECVQFCSALKDENADLSSWADADILAHRASWTAPEVSKQKAAGKSYRKPKTESSGASVVSDGGSAPAPAEAEAPSASADEASVSSDKKKPGPVKGKKWSPEAKASAAAKRAAKKASKTDASVEDAPASSSAVLPLLPPSPADSDAEDELAGFQRVSLAGARYWVNMKDGRAYHRESDDSRGEWAGLFVRDPKPRIDDSVADPNAELTFTDVDELD